MACAVHDAQLTVGDALVEGVRVFEWDRFIGTAVDCEDAAALDGSAVGIHVQAHPVVHVLHGTRNS